MTMNPRSRFDLFAKAPATVAAMRDEMQAAHAALDALSLPTGTLPERITALIAQHQQQQASLQSTINRVAELQAAFTTKNVILQQLYDGGVAGKADATLLAEVQSALLAGKSSS